MGVRPGSGAATEPTCPRGNRSVHTPPLPAWKQAKTTPEQNRSGFHTERPLDNISGHQGVLGGPPVYGELGDDNRLIGSRGSLLRFRG